MFVRNIYIAVVYVLALNFFVKSVLFVPCLPRGFVLGTRFKFYVLKIFFFFFWGGGGAKDCFYKFLISLFFEGKCNQKGKQWRSEWYKWPVHKVTILFDINFCIFHYCGMANYTEVISHCTDKRPCIGTYADLWNAFILRGEQLYDSISLLSSKGAFVFVCVCA